MMVVFSTANVAAQTNERKARAAFRLGRAHYDNGDFLKAAEQFENAYKYSMKSQLLYNVYLAYRDANIPRKAADALHKYLKDTKDVPNRAQLEARLVALERGLQEEEEKPPVVPVQEQPEVSQTQEPKEEPPKPPEETKEEVEPETEPSSDAVTVDDSLEDTEAADSADDALPVVPLVLMGVGGAMIIGSVITGIMTASAQSELEDNCPDKRCPQNVDIEDLKSTQSDGKTFMIVTDVLLFGGIAAAGTGLVLFLLQSGEQESSDSMATTVGCSSSGCSGSFRLQF